MAGRGPSHGHRGSSIKLLPATHRSVEVGYPGDVSGKFLYAKDNYSDGKNDGSWQQEEEIKVPTPRAASSPRTDETTPPSSAKSSIRGIIVGNNASS